MAPCVALASIGPRALARAQLLIAATMATPKETKPAPGEAERLGEAATHPVLLVGGKNVRQKFCNVALWRVALPPRPPSALGSAETHTLSGHVTRSALLLAPAGPTRPSRMGCHRGPRAMLASIFTAHPSGPPIPAPPLIVIALAFQ